MPNCVTCAGLESKFTVQVAFGWLCATFLTSDVGHLKAKELGYVNMKHWLNSLVTVILDFDCLFVHTLQEVMDMTTE